ncbi:hypothetical protein ACFW0H_27860 [Pseudomonas sp. CR3202]
MSDTIPITAELMGIASSTHPTWLVLALTSSLLIGVMAWHRLRPDPAT